MDVIQKISQEFQPQWDFFREKIHLFNVQLSQVYSPLQLIAVTVLITTVGIKIYRFLFVHDEDISVRIRNWIFRWVRRLPMVKRKIAQTKESTLKSVFEDIAKSVAGHEFVKSLPEKGLAKDELLDQLENYRNFEKINYKSGQVSGCVYKIPKPDLTEIYHRVFNLFGETNPLHVDVFPDIRTMEAEVVRCVASMFHGDSNVCGTMTSGGTESILMACKTYRDLAYSKGITKPEL